MEVKISRNTPFSQVIETINSEGIRTCRWLDKKYGSEDRKKKKHIQDVTDANNKKYITHQVVDYNSKQSNHWVVFDSSIRKSGTSNYYTSRQGFILVDEDDDTFVIAETYNPEKDEGEWCYFEKSFFDCIKYKSDKKVEGFDVDKAVDFFAKNYCNVIGIVDSIGYIIFDKCIGTAEITDNVLHFNKLIYQDDIDDKTAESLQNLFAAYDKQIETHLQGSEEDKEDYSEQLEMEDIRIKIENGHISHRCSGYVSDNLAIFFSAVNCFSDILGRKIPYRTIPIDDFLFDRFKAIRKCRSGNKQESLLKYAEEITKIAWHSGLSEIQLEDVYEKLTKYPKNKTFIKTNTMNQRAKTMFKNLLSRTGLTKKFTKYSEGIDNNLDRYIEQAESIYILSRVYPFVVDIKDKEKLINANKLWIKIVIENDFCPELRTYISDFGKDKVISAIIYLIDNDLWTSPEGNKALRVKMPTNYDGFNDIPSAVEYLKTEQIDDTSYETDETEEPELASVFEESTSSEPQKSISDVQSIALQSANNILTALDMLRDEAHQILKYAEQDDLVTLLEQENKELSVKHEKQCAKLNKKITELTDSIVVSQQKFHAEEKARKEAEERAYEKSKECKSALEQRDKAIAELSRLRADFEEFKEKAKNTDEQKLTIYRVSEIENISLMGRSILKDLIPLLEKKKNVKVIRDGKKWDDGVRYNIK